jgi:VWFA-related protein
MTTGVLAGWMLLCAWAAGAGAQLATAQAAAAPAQAAPAATAPAQAAQQKQTPPSVDSDPVPSPDPDTRTPVPAPKGTTPKTGEITKENGHYTLRTNAYEVRLNASVVDSSGQVVENLTQDAFHVYEDGVPQTIIGFRHEDVPVSLGILIDSSGSMYDKRAAVDAASLDLVRLSNRQDEAFLVDFSSEAYIDQDFTGSIDKLQQGLAYIKSSGGTAMYDAVIASADYLSKNAKRSKQVLLIVTDGDDNASSGTLEQTIRRVQDLDGPAIYCIGLLFGEDVSHSESRHSREVLMELAAQTGGQAYFPRSLKEVDGIAREVAQDIRQQYTIEYRSTKSPELGGYRQIHVEAKEKGYRGLQVRTRPGYFPKVAGTGGTRSETSGK